MTINELIPGASDDPLTGLICAADARILGELLRKVAAGRPDIKRECLEFLGQRLDLSPEIEADVAGGEALAMWEELEPDLSELDEYGGGDDEQQERVGNLLYRLTEKLQETRADRENRRDLLQNVLGYIRSGNAGVDDTLYEVAYAACYDDEDLAEFAVRLEELCKPWSDEHAMRIYRRLGDCVGYLALRHMHLKCGSDYHDLASYYAEQGDHEKARWPEKGWRKQRAVWRSFASSLPSTP